MRIPERRRGDAGGAYGGHPHEVRRGEATLSEVSLQDRFAPETICFGCGPANERGLRIKSYLEGDEVVARFTPEEHHQAFPGVINGGIIGALLDCHMNWTAAHGFVVERQADKPPVTVTAEFSVRLKRVTPAHEELTLRATVAALDGDRAEIVATVEAAGTVTAEGRGTFVAVEEGHPAYHRW